MDEKKQIKKLQDNLKQIRNEAGWTATQLGDRIGVSKQAICNIENGRCNLTKTQYIAIRAVIDHESATNPEKNDLSEKVEAILSYNEEEERILNMPDSLLSKEGLEEKEKIKNKKKVLPKVAGAVGAAAVLALSIKWMNDILGDS